MILRYTALFALALLCCFTKIQASVIEVPSQSSTIREAVDQCLPGDTILISPGIYTENILVNRPVTIGSLYLTTGDTAYAGQTIVDGGGESVFSLSGYEGESTRIAGLTIRNGDDGIMAAAPMDLERCIITACEDGIDYETGGAGTCRYNLFHHNTDDAIDLDGTLGTLLIEFNMIRDNEDDGIEIRLHRHQGEPTFCLIAGNVIRGNGEDGIQFIDYADTSHRVYRLERNLIHDNAMAGIGCMDEGDTREDYRAAPIPEPIHLFNNTISGHVYGLTGGANLLAVNNLFLASSESGIKGLTGQSILSHSLFHQNQRDLEDTGIPHRELLFKNPLLDPQFIPDPGSPCIDRGTPILMVNGDTLLNIPEEDFTGTAPDIGALESGYTASRRPTPPEAELAALPNPFGDFLTVRQSGSLPLENFCLRIWNRNGILMAEKSPDQFPFRFDTSEIPAGLYLMEIQGKKVHKSLKIIKL